MLVGCNRWSWRVISDNKAQMQQLSLWSPQYSTPIHLQLVGLVGWCNYRWCWGRGLYSINFTLFPLLFYYLLIQPISPPSSFLFEVLSAHFLFLSAPPPKLISHLSIISVFLIHFSFRVEHLFWFLANPFDNQLNLIFLGKIWLRQITTPTLPANNC